MKLSILLIISAVTIAVLPFIGMEFISVGEVLSDALQREIFLSIRVSRVLTAFAAGSALSVCGLVFQGIFRNPMADPFTLGVASGASFGAALTVLTGAAGAVMGVPLTAIGALCGAGVSFALVMAFAARMRRGSSSTILLAGIAVSFFFSSLLMFSQYMSSMRDSFRIVRWLMGGVEVYGYAPLLTMLPFVAAGMILIAAKVAVLDHFLTGEDIAQTRGIRVGLSRNILLAAASLTVGGVVSVCGPIGFVGMMIPHINRGIFGHKHKILFPTCLLTGGIFLSTCDTIARTIIAPAEIPVGVITALLGCPFLIWILRKK